MANTAVSVTQLVRDSVTTTGVASTGLSAVLSTANTYYIPVTADSLTTFRIAWNHCATSTDYAMGVIVNDGNSWRGGVGEADFTLWTTSCGIHEWSFGPFETARFGTLSTSTTYGAEIGEQYITLYIVLTSSSGANSDSTATAAAQGDAYIRAYQLPRVTYST